MIKRHAYQYLRDWKEQKPHKPLILRGARQTGKTFLVKDFGKTFTNFVYINCETNDNLKKLFRGELSIKVLVRNLELLTDTKITPNETLLFFDEVQEIPEVIKFLRYFYEELPDLHVITAGSLLDFTLDNIGVPVGRVSFLHLYPISFLEFLDASDHQSLIDEILHHPISQPLNSAIHEKLLNLLNIYLAVGGMPEATQNWLNTYDLPTCSKIHHELANAYRQDFQKYATKFQMKYVNLLFDRIPANLGQQFKYTNVSQEYRKRELMPCLDLLSKAQIITKVIKSAGNGVPLGAEADPDKFKVIFLDVALSQAILGLQAKDWLLFPEETYINRGAIIEAFVGQELRAYSSPHTQSSLYYWQREDRGSSAEVDYLLENGNSVIPIEVKSGTTGTLRSMHYFLQQKIKSPYGVRFSSQNYSIVDRIHSYPLYAIAKIADRKFIS